METSQAAPDDTPVEEQRSTLNFPVVGLGASAGGLTALMRFFDHMPAQPGMAFVVVMHLSPEHESNLDLILQKRTRLPVTQVAQRTRIELDHVYVIMPSLLLTLDDGHLDVAPLERKSGRHVAVDMLFRSLAQAMRERAVGVVLSGTGSDGAVGLRRIKELGGVTLAQSPGDAEHDSMPASAMATGAVDFVLPADEMPTKLIDLWANAQRIELPQGAQFGLQVSAPTSEAAAARAEQALQDVMVLLRTRTGHDFRHYKRATVLRRIERRLQVNGMATLPAYQSFLEEQPSETPALLKDMLISVTNFFRDAEAFDALGQLLGVRLFGPGADNRRVRAWVAGCATGEEAYSLAIELQEAALRHGAANDLQIFATDIDERAIAVGRTGLYPAAIAADVSPERLSGFFTPEESKYRVRKSLRERVLFAAHNLLRDPPFSSLDVVCCRNLLIYLERDVQIQVLEILHFGLREGGLLFLGSSESADVAQGLFSVVDKKNRIYVANEAPRQRRLMPRLPMAGGTPLMPVPLQSGGLATTPPRSALADLHQRLAQHHGAATALLDREGNILHSSARAGDYLRFAGGLPTQNLLAVIRPEFRLELRTALYDAEKAHQAVQARPVRLDDAQGEGWLVMTVRPVDETGLRFMLVSFDRVHSTLLPLAGDGAERDPVLALLEEELQKTHDQLLGSINRSANSTEELKASNEELQAINEELRSAGEELETSKEELQSVNEELITVNHELKLKVDETSRINDDLRNLIASTDIATVFVDRGLRIKRFTPRAADIFNVIESDVGRSLLDITRRVSYPDLEGDVAATFDTLRPFERELDGPDDRHYLARLLPYRTNEDVIDGAVLTFVDISATRRAEAQARASETDMRLLVQSTQDYGIMTLDGEGCVRTWNVGAELLFGFKAEEMVGKPPFAIFTPKDREGGVFESELRRAREEGRADDERWHVAADGRSFFCSGVMTPLRENGVLKGYAKIVRDFTEAKHTEARLAKLLQSEQAIRSELQAASVMKDEFLAVMSHELKHPLNLIQINAELLSRLPEVREVPTVARAADVIRRTVLSQAKIIDDLLDLSRLHTGKLTLNLQPVDFAVVIGGVVDAVRAEAQALGLSLTVELDPMAALVQADAVRVEQIVWNLVSNALKFTPPGGSIRLRLTHEEQMARLEVSDSGRGIEADFLPQVFDMFRQAGRGTTRPQSGLGIGLALVKHLAEQHGGRVAVASEGLGHGATFTLWLPLSEAVGLMRPSPLGLPALKGLRILVVDDTSDTLDSFTMLLELEGGVVTPVNSGAQALEVVARGAEFDLIVSDIAMPGMDGYELIGRLRQIERLAHVPALALTGFGRASDERRALAAGFDAHLAKPVSLEALIQAVHRIRR